jgi:DNA-binding transcriptional ArsR family regulator
MPGPALRVVAASDHPFSPDALVLAPEDWSGVPDALIPVRTLDPSGPEGRARAARREAQFIKGPLPLGWVAIAARAGHPLALPVLLALKYKADTVCQPWVKPPAAVLRLLGVDKDARSRAIAALERAGLVEVRRRKGRPPLVRLVPWAPRPSGGGAGDEVGADAAG